MAARSQIPVFILAGGLGTRISEETQLKPKPMVEIGEIPVLVHIMRSYYAAGFDDFVICAGYKSGVIKEFFLNYEFRRNHLMIDHRTSMNRPAEAFGRSEEQERWRVRVIDTGLESMTGARIARAFDAVSSDGFTDFAVTYGDGVSDVDLVKELAFHEKHGRIGTVLGVHPSARFGELEISPEGCVNSFQEKPQSSQDFINGGFFFFKKGFREYLSTEPDCILERKPLATLASDGQLMMYKHEGFWQPMDTLRDKNYLEGIWQKGEAPWVRKAPKSE